MGRLSLEEMGKEMAEMTQVITWHLTSNHYPPVPVNMVDPCLIAIGACNDGQPNFEVALPDGITWRGRSTAPAWAIIEGHHLEYFLEENDDDY
jgi:hypothetical protein